MCALPRQGQVSHFPKIRRELQLAIAPELFPHIHGNTESETFFLLAVTHGLMDNPETAIENHTFTTIKHNQVTTQPLFN